MKAQICFNLFLLMKGVSDHRFTTLDFCFGRSDHVVPTDGANSDREIFPLSWTLSLSLCLPSSYEYWTDLIVGGGSAGHPPAGLCYFAGQISDEGTSLMMPRHRIKNIINNHEIFPLTSSSWPEIILIVIKREPNSQYLKLRPLQ
jgi:hypothetical protein